MKILTTAISRRYSGNISLSSPSPQSDHITSTVERQNSTRSIVKRKPSTRIDCSAMLFQNSSLTALWRFDALPVTRFFLTSLQVLHVEIPDNSKTVFVYVTDYTRRLDLDLSNDEWAKNLKGMVVMVKLQDQQADKARLKIVKPGAFYRFRKLRLRARQLHGTLGGSQALIQQLGNNSPLVEDLLRQVRRQDAF
jgi:hypothetical protein